jgi:catechol 2,3-dioxygenase
MQPISTRFRLHDDTRLGSVSLKVSHLQRSILFYTHVIGLSVLNSDDTSASLGVGHTPLVHLIEIADAIAQPRRTTGLYHLAILLPTRRDLAFKVKHLIQVQYPFGYADHLVSEAFYLDDPDGNGIEIYRDRPRSEWTWRNGTLQMDNAQIDFDSLFAEVEGETIQADMPVGTVLGHMHLRVGDAQQAEKFYGEMLGFDTTTHMPSAAFMSAGGYHHHLGLNAWQSQNGKSAPENSVGLRHFEVILPNGSEVQRVAQHLTQNAVEWTQLANGIRLNDPWQNTIHFINA